MRRTVRRCLTLTALILAALPVAAQEIPEGYREGTHIVREGENLRGITEAYLGSEELWKRNWILNPQVEDPDLLFPLQRLRVLLAPKIARPTARLVTISGTVEGKPAPSDWSESLEDDLMVERDGVRAREDSSTVMEFNDGSELTLRDDSTIFLRVAGRSLQGIEERSVEILEGEADLAAAALPDEIDIEIVIGGTVTTTKGDDSGVLETRARKIESGSQVMVFEGVAAVASAGETVMLEAGMGSSIPEAGPPAPPEKLLPSSSGLLPADGDLFELERSRFAWQPVAGAASYTVELCRDSTCGELVRRETGLGEDGWEVDDLPTGKFLWRVTAVSDSGLDGYPSAAQFVKVIANRHDDLAPSGEFTVTGSSVVEDGVTYYGADLQVAFSATDEGTGVDNVTLLVDGAEVDTDRLAGSWTSGDYELAATVVDASGNSASIGPLELHVDTDPPAVTWSVGGPQLLAPLAGGEQLDKGFQKRLERASRREMGDIQRGRVRPRWTVLAWQSQLPSPSARFTPGSVSNHRSHDWFVLNRRDVEVVLFAPGVVIDDRTERLESKLVLIESKDDRSGQEKFRVWRRAGPDALYWLEVEAIDRLENRRVVRWPFPIGD